MLWDKDHKKVSKENDQFKKKKKKDILFSIGEKNLQLRKKYESPELERLAITLSSRLVGPRLSSWLQPAVASVFSFIFLASKSCRVWFGCCQSPQWSFVISRNQVQSPYFTLVLANLLLGLM